MTKPYAAILMLLLACSGLWAESETKPVVSKKAPLMKPAPIEGPEGNFGPGGSGTPESLPIEAGARVATDTVHSISQEVEAASHDEIPIDLEPPPMNLPFKDVVGFSRPGQTERVLTGPVDHLPANEILGMAVLDFRQGVSPLQFQIPSPPFVKVEVPRGGVSSHWSLHVVDQAEKTVYQEGGMRVPQDLVVWDGFKDGEMVLLAGVIYQPILMLVDARGFPQQHFGDPIQLDVLQFDQGNVRHVEFNNNVLFQRDSTDFERDAIPLVRSLLNLLRENVEVPFRFAVHEDPGGGVLAEKRQDKLKRFLEDVLVLESDHVLILPEPTKDRGPVTEFLINVSTGTRP